jgi:hypothetical protein
MRPLPQERETKSAMRKSLSAWSGFALTAVLLAAGAWTLGCGGGGAGSIAPPPPPPPSITVGVTPQSGTVLLGETLQFTATVSHTSDPAVVWSVNGTAGGSLQAGTISADGVYMAPIDLPSGETVQVTASGHADSSKSATVSVIVSSDISVSISTKTANVELGAIHWTPSSSVPFKGGSCPPIRSPCQHRRRGLLKFLAPTSSP